MSSRLLASTGLLVIGIAACSTSADHTATGEGGTMGATGTGGAATGTGGGNATGAGGTSAGTGGSPAGTGGATTTGAGGADGSAIGAGGAATGSGGAVGSIGVGGAQGAGGNQTSGTGGGRNDASAAGGGAPADASTSGSGGGSGAEAAALTIRANDVGDFANSFMISTCAAAGSGFDCPNTLANQVGCSTTPWNAPTGLTTENTGTTYSEVFTVTGGDPTRTYAITVRVRGQTEPRGYVGGTSALGATGAANPNAVNNLLYTGGQPGTTHVDYNVFMLTIAPPAGGQPIAGQPTFFAFNGVDSAHEGAHFNFQIDETFTFMVKTGFVLTLTNHDSNCVAIKNCGNGGPYGFTSAALCEAQARTVPGVTLPATFRGTALPSAGAQPYQTQFVNFQVMSIVAQ